MNIKKVQNVCYTIHLVNMYINVVKVIIHYLYNITIFWTERNTCIVYTLSLDESLVQQNLK